ncbi:MAG: KGGVGR-motif variant AAA ATPase [Janthinobacterium lividum]
MLTFHSFKGGMGRTTLALSLASALSAAGRRVLFIDADFEAPGVSTLLKQVMPNPRIAFADLLTIAHVSTDPEANEAIELVASRLRDQEVGNLLFLPCTRDLGLPNVSPDSLTLSSKRSPFFVGSLVAKLGRAVGAELTIVDLRAGLSELVASLFLDPRLQHTLVTTLNGQAIDGTIMLLERMREMGAKWQIASGSQLDATLPTVIINQVPVSPGEGHAGHESASAAMGILEEELRLFLDQSRFSPLQQEKSPNPFQDATITTTIVATDPTVAILPRGLRDVQRILLRSTLPEKMLAAFSSIISAGTTLEQSVDGKVARRRKLAEYAQKSVFAESQPQADIFPTASLVNLAERHQATLPAVAVVGEKGAGKSYTFMSLALATTWGAFSKRLGITTDAGARVSGALILPVTSPHDLDDDARAAERRVTSATARAVSNHEPLNDQLITDVMEEQVRSPDASSAVAWRNFWLDLIAWRAGFAPGTRGAFETLTILMPQDASIVAIFDGIETLFSRLRTSEVEQTAVEALLRLVPDWLSQLPQRNVGCIIFIREDLARYALINNFKQFEDRYLAYSLRWNWAEASSLALWIAQRAESLPVELEPQELLSLNEEARSQALADLWGWKMGPNTSREARSLEWTMSSLSDFNRRIKARDLVRFLAESARNSTPDDAYYDDRLLSPRAMREAIGPCSVERVSETAEENADLERIFQKVQSLTGNERELPWSYSRAQSLIGPDDARVLEDNGVLFRSGDEFFLPELYRSGLNLRYYGGARRKVVTLMRQAAGRSP